MNLKLLPCTILISIFLGIVVNNELDFMESQESREHAVYIKTFKEQKKGKVLLNVPIVSQRPELYNGCEVCCLTMLLQYKGIKVNKITMAQKIRKDKTPLILDKKGKIVKWGNPNDGFVGDITGRKMGYGTHAGPIRELLEKYLPGKSINLTGQPFDRILNSIDEKRPVIIWVTIDFAPPNNHKCWKKNGRIVRVTFDEHAVLLVGYDKNYCYINNPYNGMKNQRVKKDVLIKSWNSMGNMAVSYR